MKYKAVYLVILISILVGVIYICLHLFSNGIHKMDCEFNTEKFLMPDGCASEFFENPILQFKCPPEFTKMAHENIKLGLKCGLEFYKINFKNFEEEIENGTRSVTWENVVDYVEIIEAPKFFGEKILELLLMVNYSNLLQDVAKELNPLITVVEDLKERSTNFHSALKNLRNQKGLPHFKKAYLSRTLDRINDRINPKLQKEFEQLKKVKYENIVKYKSNIMSSKEELAFLVYKRSEVLGMPSDILNQMSANAKKIKNLNSSAENWPWLLTMDPPISHAVNKYLKNKLLREKFWKRLTQVGCTKNYNNSEVIDRLSEVMERLAQINGYASYIQSILANSMAQNSSTVLNFLEKLYNKTKDKVNEKLTNLKSYGSLLGIKNFLVSDLYYIENKYFNAYRNVNATAIRQHFPKEHVINEIFNVIKDLFKIDIMESKDNDDFYAPNVRFYNVYDVDEEHLGSIYLDIDSRRQTKTSLAWTSTIRRSVPSLNVKPIVLIAANFDLQGTLTIANIQIFFHELGHALQIILTSNYASQPYKDADEAPSKFMEHFALNHEVLKRLSLPRIPEEILNHIDKQHRNISCIKLLKKIFQEILDQKIFLQINESWSTVNKNVFNKYDPMTNTLNLCNFKHIFIYGYGGSYYSYLWSEAIALQLHHYLYQDDHSLKEKAMKIRRLVFERKNMSSDFEIFELLLGSNIPDEAYLLQYYGL